MKASGIREGRGRRLPRPIPKALVAVLSCLAVSCAPIYERPAVTGSTSFSDPLAARGELVFFENCHGCHPHGGEGLGLGVTDKPLPDFAIRFQVRNGLGEMPAFGPEEIDESELEALIVYLRELRELWAGPEG